ncbi:MAG: tetratricopeptide repeat protein [Bacteroidota bacterium]
MKRRVTIIALALAMLAPEAFAREYSQVDSLKAVLAELTDPVDLAATNYSIAGQLFASPVEALPYITEALAYAEKTGDDQLISKSAYVFGLINDQLSKTKDAFLGYYKGLEAYARLEVIEYAAECHLGLGRMYLLGHQTDKAKEHFDQASALLVNETGEARWGFNMEIADLYFQRSEYQNAVTYYQLALDYQATTVQFLNTQLKIGNSLQELGEYDGALQAYSEVEANLSEVENSSEYQGIVEFNRGVIAQVLGNHEQALAKFEVSLALEDGSYIASEQWTLNHMSESYLALGDPSRAADLLAESIAKGRDEFGSAEPFLHSFELAIQVAEVSGDISTAFAYQQDYQSYLVSEQQIETEVSDAKAVLEIQMAENEILTAQLAAAERVKLWAVSIAGALGVIVLAMLLVRFINRNKRLQAKFNRKQAAIKELKRMTVSEEW